MSIPQLPPTPPCQEWDRRVPNPFGYHPSLSTGITFTIIFTACTICHVWQAWRYRGHWLIFFILGALGEVSGWLSRTVAWECPYSVQVYEAQLASLIMAPAYTTAGVYATLAFMLPLLPPHPSLFLKPKIYVTTFLLVDFFSLLLQAVGGGMAGAAFSRHEDTTTATTIMISGIVFQLASTAIFSFLFEYVVLFRGARVLAKNIPLLVLSIAIMVTVTTMVIRGIFRSMELMNGWRGMLATTEKFQIALEGSMMAIGMVSLNIWHPERLLREAKQIADEQVSRTNALPLRPQTDAVNATTKESSRREPES